MQGVRGRTSVPDLSSRLGRGEGAAAGGALEWRGWSGYGMRERLYARPAEPRDSGVEVQLDHARELL